RSFLLSGAQPPLPSFPTRRSSDLIPHGQVAFEDAFSRVGFRLSGQSDGSHPTVALESSRPPPGWSGKAHSRSSRLAGRGAFAPRSYTRRHDGPNPDRTRKRIESDCVFCGIVRGALPSTTIAETERTVAFMDINPVTAGHALVVPRSHATDLLDVESEDLAACVE